MTTTLYTTRELAALIEPFDKPVCFLRDTFFKTPYLSEKEEVVFDDLDENLSIAPFVSPLNPGKERAMRGSTSTSYKPPYLKPLHVVNPADSLKRFPGEMLNGGMDQASRRDLIITQNLMMENDSIDRREELMCSEVLQTGSVAITGQPDHEDVSISYNRPAGHTIALTSTARWGESGVSPVTSLRSWAQTMATNRGGIPMDVVMGPSAMDLFLDDASLQKNLENRRQDGGIVQFFGGATGAGQSFVLMGQVREWRIWQYSQQFKNDAGASVEVFPAYGVLMASSLMSGWMVYGAIQDEEALTPSMRFQTMWQEKNPSRTLTMTQAAPLPVLGRAEATLFATVR